MTAAKLQGPFAAGTPCTHMESRVVPVSQPVRVAVVGYGLGGSVFHAPLIDVTAGLALDAIVTSNPQRQAAARGRYPGVRVIPTVEQLLSHADEWDLVVVSVPNADHYAVAESAMRAGMSAVVDKPVTPTSAESERLGQVAREHGVSLIPYHNRRWDGDFLTVLELLGAERLGRIWRFESRFERWSPGRRDPLSWKQDPHLAGGGVLFDLGSHLVDQALRLFGPPSSVYAEVTRHSAPVDDDAFVALAYSSGIAVHLWASSTAARLGPRFRILGSQSAYVKFGLDPQEGALRAGRLPSEPGWGEEPAEAWGQIGTVHSAELVPTRPGAYQSFYAGVAAHLVENAAPPVEISDAITGLRVLEAAVASAASGAVIPIA